MLAMQVQTRYMTKGDFGRVMEINHTSSGGYAWQPDDLWNEWQADKGAGMAAVDADDYLLGFCIYNMDDKECYEIQHLVVEKCFQRSGIGTALINRMKKKLNDMRCILSYSVPEDNLPFQLFMKKMGFKAKLVRNGTEEVYRFEYEKV